MSDRSLRELEHELSRQPDSAPLHVEYARVLTRVGRQEPALAALDLAWRLGAEEVYPELQQRLEERVLEVAGVRFRYIPAGPFVMGSDAGDPDEAPAHLVRLSAYYLAEKQLPWGAIWDWPDGPHHQYGGDAEWRRQQLVANLHFEQLIGALTQLTQAVQQVEGLGHLRASLPSEAQWERAHRVDLLLAQPATLYGGYGLVVSKRRPEWTADLYDSSYYGSSAARDPNGPESGKERVLRGVPLFLEEDDSPSSHLTHSRVSPAALARYVTFRESCRPDGTLQGKQPGWFGASRRRHLPPEEGIGLRPCLVAAKGEALLG